MRTTCDQHVIRDLQERNMFYVGLMMNTLQERFVGGVDAAFFWIRSLDVHACRFTLFSMRLEDVHRSLATTN